MNSQNHKKMPPKAPSNFQTIFAEEILAFWSFLTSNWIYLLPSVFLACVLIYIVRPLPPRHLTIATGQPHTTADIVGHKYQEYFHQHGVELELVPTKGAEENIRLLSQGKVDSVFSQGGIDLSDSAQNVVSLGAIAYQPLWLFYHGPESNKVDLNEFLLNRKTSINIEGSGTRVLVDQVLAAQGVDLVKSNLLTLNTADSLQAFKTKKIDAIFLVGNMESQNVREIAALEDVHPYSFQLAEAYAKKFRYLDPIVLPVGALSFHPVLPQNEVHMISTTLDVLTTNHLHPALQLLFLEAAEDFDQKRVSFFSNGHFPLYMDIRIPESNVAQRFFKKGSPALWGRVPFWAASLFDEVWFYLIAIGAIVIPLFSFVPSYRKQHADLSIESCYNELRAIENEIAWARTASVFDKSAMIDRIDLLNEKVHGLWIPTGNRSAYYDLRSAINIVREDVLADFKNFEA